MNDDKHKLIDFQRQILIHEREHDNHKKIYSDLIKSFDNLYEE